MPPLPTPTAGESKNDFVSRCMSNATIKADYGKGSKQAVAVCFSQWRRKNGGSKPTANDSSIDGLEFDDDFSEGRFLAFKSLPALSRTETKNGQKFIVVPVVAMVEGVRRAANSPIAEFVPIAEFQAELADWNGLPVTIHHPRQRGQYIAYSKGGFDPGTGIDLGFVADPKIVGKKFKLEAWVNEAKLNLAIAEGNNDAKALQDKIVADEEIEISAGYFAKHEDRSGTYNGKKFDGVQRAITGDHLALLPKTTGACSIIDGCGVRMNANGEIEIEGEGEAIDGCACGTCENCAAVQEARETSVNETFKTLEAFDGAEFAIDESLKANSKTLSDTNVRDALRAALAIEARQSGGYPPGVAHVFESGNSGTMILDRYPHMTARDFSMSQSGNVTLHADEHPVRPVTKFVRLAYKKKPESPLAQGSVGQSVTAYNAGESHETSKANESVKTDKSDKSEKTLLQSESSSGEDSTHSVNSTNSANSSVSTQEETTTMTRKDRIDAALKVNGCLWAEDDRDMLMALTDGQFDKAMKTVPPASTPTPEPSAPTVIKVPKIEANERPNPNPSPTPEPTPTPTPEPKPGVTANAAPLANYLSALPPEVRKIVARSLAQDKQRRAKMNEVIKANEASDFTDEFLDALEIEDLEALTRLALAANAKVDENERVRSAADLIPAGKGRRATSSGAEDLIGDGIDDKKVKTNEDGKSATAYLRSVPRNQNSDITANENSVPDMPLVFEKADGNGSGNDRSGKRGKAA